MGIPDLDTPAGPRVLMLLRRLSVELSSAYPSSSNQASADRGWPLCREVASQLFTFGDVD
jgi:hypothetical protein